jgi:tetratricopeptide (TPR) repeat protein
MHHPNLLLATKNRKAFELVASGLNRLEAFKNAKNWEEVRSAATDLDKAVTLDPAYTAARYYAGIADDLAGRAADGAKVLAPLLNQSLDPKFIGYVRYALAMAEYHQYHSANLARAAEILADLLAAAPEYLLETSAYALLSQVRAMQEISKGRAAAASAQQPVDAILPSWKQSQVAAKHAIALLNEPQAKELDSQLCSQLRAMADNALGMSEMYLSDYDEAERSKRLESALKHLLDAERTMPNDWANTCDLGSVHLRFGYANDDPAEFDEARRYLQHVLDELRPDYGFAFYEIGRTYRIQGQFKEALAWFERAEKVPKEYRDVSNDTLEEQMKLAHTHSKHYPP